MEEKDFMDKMGFYDTVPRSDAAKKMCRVIRTRWVKANKGSDDNHQIRARRVAQVAGVATSMSTSQKRPIWLWSKLW